MNVLSYEVNFLTAQKMSRHDCIQTISAEFDFVRMCQGMMKPFGLEARKALDRFLALSLRKLLCDKTSLLTKVCTDFKMPPLIGDLFECPGEQNDMMLNEIQPDIQIKPQNEWIPLNEWLNTTIAWIDKGIDDIPDAYSDRFFVMLSNAIGNQSLADYCICEETENNEKTERIWIVKDSRESKEGIYNILKNKGYYDLSIRRLIKYYADKKGAHLQPIDSHWIDSANSGKNWQYTAMSVFATQMIYAATKQIRELENYIEINPMIETL